MIPSELSLGAAWSWLIGVAAFAAAFTPVRAKDVPQPAMVRIPAGLFIMGVPDAEEVREQIPENLRHLAAPLHPVTIPRDFDLGVYPVTRDEFATFVAESGYSMPKGCATVVGTSTRVNAPDRDWRNPGFPQTGRDPVVCVNHADARTYVDWLSQRTGEQYRLPTEAEWEYAARAGTTTARHWGDDQAGERLHSNLADLSLAAVLHERWNPEGYVPWDDGFAFTAPVGSFAPNQFGLYDMLGNVWQWTEDCWHNSYAGAPTDGTAWSTGDCRVRVLRGASWGNFPRAARSGLRSASNDGNRSAYYGFRVARTRGAPIA